MTRLSGLYFVLDPPIGPQGLLKVMKGALEGGVDVGQVWAAWSERRPYIEVVKEIEGVTRGYDVPLLINNDLAMARTVGAELRAHGPVRYLNPSEIRERLGDHCIVGNTVGDELSRVTWAESVGSDYVSFCSIFPSPSVSDCESVTGPSMVATYIQPDSWTFL